jgi:ArsR family transcriptional regulator, arsenate/arsenite/antimonite-responsive transcriptional repressor
MYVDTDDAPGIGIRQYRYPSMLWYSWRMDATTTVSDALPLFDVIPQGAEACCPPILGGVLTEEQAQQAARVFKALADPARVRILSIIAAADAQESCVCDFTDVLDLAQPTISHHLKVLKDAGLLERERRGSWAYYRLRPETLSVLSLALCP